MSENRRFRCIPLGGLYDPVDDEEAAALGRALVARIRGEPLTPSEEALLSRLGSRGPEDERAPSPVLEVSETLATFERGPDAEVRVTWRSYKGSSPFLDIRRWERAPGQPMRPTQKGVTIRMREISRLMQVVVQVARKLGESPGTTEDE